MWKTYKFYGFLLLGEALGGGNFNNASSWFAGEPHLCYIISITQISNPQKVVDIEFMFKIPHWPVIIIIFTYRWQNLDAQKSWTFTMSSLN